MIGIHCLRRAIIDFSKPVGVSSLPLPGAKPTIAVTVLSTGGSQAKDAAEQSESAKTARSFSF